MSFWKKSTGEKVSNDGNFENGGGMEPIPNNTTAMACIEEAKWDEFIGDRFISLKWRIQKPEEFENRVVFHKLKVHGTKACKNPQNTADKALEMLGAIDKNCGGHLQKADDEPNNHGLHEALVGHVMLIKIMLWEIDDKKGNWVAAVAPPRSLPPAQPREKTAPKPTTTQAPESFDPTQDVPF